jgi:dihydrofolate reductase
VFICGGASIYRQTIDRADQLYITLVNQEPDGDVFFPVIDPQKWKEDWREDHGGFSFIKYKKI